MNGRTPVEILIVTGPLGAGKTTVVNRLLKAEIAAGRRVAVLINEFGAISVDGTLLDADRPELAGVQNLVNGCVCCSLRNDVVTTLQAWCDQPEDQRPERVVLETTGLADPTDLLDLELEPALAGRLRLAGLLTVLSCLTPVDHLRTKPLLHRQAALASLIHLSKADLDPSAAVAWEGELRSAFRDIPLVATRHGRVLAVDGHLIALAAANHAVGTVGCVTLAARHHAIIAPYAVVVKDGGEAGQLGGRRAAAANGRANYDSRTREVAGVARNDIG